MHRILRFLKNEDGPTAVEYAFMLALILLACISMIALVGTNTAGMWNNSQQKLQNAGFGAS